MNRGVSIVVCCHNSALRLPATLAHLAAQETTATVPWEVIVVDNASTDCTEEAALANWPANSVAPLRVVSEPTPGVSHARLKGILESRYELVSFVDDDNWVCPEWVAGVSELMSSHPEIGACGGRIEAVFEVPPPVWFGFHCGCYAVGEQALEAGDITDERGYLWGAGLTIRRVAILRLLSAGFRFLTTGREGATLMAGEDAELCFALRLAGWRLWYEPHLRLRHHVSASRLSWGYLRRIVRGFGAASVGLAGYHHLFEKKQNVVARLLRRSWLWEALVTLAKLSVLFGCHPVALIRRSEGHPMVLKGEWHLGRLQELSKRRWGYRRIFRRVQEAAWH